MALQQDLSPGSRPPGLPLDCTLGESRAHGGGAAAPALGPAQPSPPGGAALKAEPVRTISRPVAPGPDRPPMYMANVLKSSCFQSSKLLKTGYSCICKVLSNLLHGKSRTRRIENTARLLPAFPLRATEQAEGRTITPTDLSDPEVETDPLFSASPSKLNDSTLRLSLLIRCKEGCQ